MHTLPPRSGRPESSRAPLSNVASVAAAVPLDRRGRARQPPGRVRGQLRLRLTLPAQEAGQDEAAQIRELLSGDISQGGLFVQCQDPPAVGEQARIEVCRPNGGLAFSAMGRVVWRRAERDALGRAPGFGLHFERLDVRNGAVVGGLLNLLKRQHTLHAAEEHALPELLLCGLDEIVRELAPVLPGPGELPLPLRRLVEAHAGAGDAGPAERRDAFLWAWAYEGIYIPTLSCVDPARYRTVLALKRQAVLLGALLDEGSPECVAYARRLHCEVLGAAAELPRFRDFAGLLELDLEQLFAGRRHAAVVRAAPHFLSETEGRWHTAPGLPFLLAGTLDLCASPGFDERETGLLREVLLHAQRMSYLTQLVTSWERRCEADDLNSGAVAYGLAQGTLSVADLDPALPRSRGQRLLVRLREARTDGHFVTEWLRDRFQARELCGRLRSVDMGRLLGKHQQLLWMQLGRKARDR